LDYALIIGGLILLFCGGEFLVRGAVALAQRMGLSTLLIGLTVVGFGTSSPELLVSVQAALDNQPDIAVGNVVGSSIANILLILGISAIIYPLASKPAVVYRDGMTMMGVTILFILFAFLGTLGFWQGLIMVIGLIVFLVYSYWSEKHYQAPSAELHEKEAEAVQPVPQSVWLSVILLIGGFLGLVVGAKLLVTGSVSIARSWGVPEAIIGLTLVAVGTSLPELATSAIAALRKETDVAVGNVLGSNIFNILLILGVAAMIRPLPINPQILTFDLWVMLASALILIPLLITGWRISRVEGFIFISLYAVYIAVLYLYFGMEPTSV
jgi:cation:H+ antiporter